MSRGRRGGGWGGWESGWLHKISLSSFESKTVFLVKCYCQALMIHTFLFGPDLFINDDGLDDGRNNFELKTCDYYSFTPSVSH